MLRQSPEWDLHKDLLKFRSLSPARNDSTFLPPWSCSSIHHKFFHPPNGPKILLQAWMLVLASPELWCQLSAWHHELDHHLYLGLHGKKIGPHADKTERPFETGMPGNEIRIACTQSSIAASESGFVKLVAQEGIESLHIFVKHLLWLVQGLPIAANSIEGTKAISFRATRETSKNTTRFRSDCLIQKVSHLAVWTSEAVTTCWLV